MKSYVDLANSSSNLEFPQELVLCISALLMALNCLQYDSQFAKSFVFPNPGIAFVIGAAAVVLLVTVIGGSFFRVSRFIGLIMFLFLLYSAISIFSSVLSQMGTVGAFAAKILSILFNIAFLISGYQLSKLGFQAFLARTILVFALLFSVPAAIGHDFGLNLNWVTISILLAFVYFLVATGTPRGLLGSFVSLSLGLYSYIFFSARGTSIAFLILSIVFLIFDVFRFKSVSRIIAGGFTLFMPAAGIIMTGFGILLYNSEYYDYLFHLSVDLTGKSIDSSRLVRWDAAFQALLERPILGWGLDSHIARVTNDYALGDIHNFWLEYFFRGGVVGGAVILVITYLIFYKIVESRSYFKYVAFAACFGVATSVYALGGLTHWPGTFFLWLIIGSLLANEDKSRSVL